MKCQECGRELPKPLGRPKKLNDKLISSMRRRAWPLSRIAEYFGVTRGAIQAALKRVALDK